MRVVASDALDAQAGVARERRLARDQTQPRCAGVAASAVVNLRGGVEIGDHMGVVAGIPFRISVGMAAAAHGRRDLRAGNGGWIIGIGGVVGGRPVAILALDARQARSPGRAAESGGHVITNRVARQTGGVGLAPVGDKLRVGEGPRVGGMRHGVDDGRMAFRADLRPGVLRAPGRRPEKFRWEVALDSGVPDQIGVFAHGQPFGFRSNPRFQIVGSSRRVRPK